VIGVAGSAGSGENRKRERQGLKQEVITNGKGQELEGSGSREIPIATVHQQEASAPNRELYENSHEREGPEERFRGAYQK